MKTKRQIGLWMVVLSIFISTPTFAAINADLIVTNVSVTKVDGNAVTISYQVKNVGSILLGSPINLGGLKFATTVSINNLEDAGDKPSGGANFPNTTLLPGQTFSGTFTASSSVNVEQFHHLIFKVTARLGWPIQESNTNNNTFVRDLTPSFADLMVNSITISNVNGSSFDYTYVVKNAGANSLWLDKCQYQISLSNDLAVDPTDIQLGTFPFVASSFLLLNPGETYTGSGSVNNAGVDLEEFNHFFLQASLKPGQVQPDKNHGNDFYDRYFVYFFSDLAFSEVNITHVNGKTFTYNFTLINNGESPIYLDRFGLNLSVSQNNLLEASDPAVGYIAIPTTQLPILPGGTYTKYGTATSPVELEQYSNFFIQANVLNGKLNPDKNHGNNTVLKSIIPTFTDLVVEDVTIDNVYGATVDYTYTIRNNGVSTLYLDRQYFQTYVSYNNSINPNNVLTGGGLFTPTPLTLSPGESFTNSGTTTATGDLHYYRFLILEARLLAGQSQPQQNHDNDHFGRFIPTSFANVMVNNIEFIATDINSVEFKYYISNTGISDLHLDQFYFETYFSADNAYDIFDIPAGDSTLSEEVLITNAYHSGTFTSAAAVNRAQYPFLIFVVKAIPGQTAYDSDPSNNQYITYAPISLSYQSFDKSLAKSGAFKVEKADDAISMENISNASQNCSYILYNMNGEKIKEGNFVQATQLSTEGLSSGIYMVRVSDGSIQETIKIFIAQ
jgi:hypothetical protein